LSLPEIVSRKVADLIPYARNARTHSDAQVAQIAASIREFGWTNPILLDGQNGIIAGHGRLMAARKLAITDVPCIELAGLTEAQRKAYILADNKLALNAGWDDEMLRLELGELAAMDFDMMLTGFSDDEFKEISGSCDEVGLPELNDGDRQPFQQMTFTVHDEQKEQIDAALLAAKSIGPFDSQNENSNGNALARVCEIFLTQHGV
jgi:ParB family chromosome partitioning protein